MASSMEEHEKSILHRFLAYTDAVFAIVLTLLILEISIPVIKVVSSSQEMLAGLKVMLPKILSFLLCFFIVTNWWTGYFYQFAYFRKVDLGMIWINNLLLLCMCVTPFLAAM